MVINFYCSVFQNKVQMRVCWVILVFTTILLTVSVNLDEFVNGALIFPNGDSDIPSTLHPSSFLLTFQSPFSVV